MRSSGGVCSFSSDGLCGGVNIYSILYTITKYNILCLYNWFMTSSHQLRVTECINDHVNDNILIHVREAYI